MFRISKITHSCASTKGLQGQELTSDAFPFGRLWYGEPDAMENAVDYAKFLSRSHPAHVSVYDETGKVVATHEHEGNFREP